MAFPAVISRARLTGSSPSEWVSLVARLVLAAVWLIAGLLKLPNLDQSVLAVRGYQLLPYDLALVVGYLLPVAEVLLGALLLIGLFVRPAAIVSGVIMLAFVIGIAQAWARGLAIDCGCFGGGGELALAEAQAKYPWDLARDTGLLLLAGWLAVRPRSPFSLDRNLFGADSAYDHDGPGGTEPTVADPVADDPKEDSLP
jgi:uncharacterized membrane protein YphA (DoxX/SURF4 family)